MPARITCLLLLLTACTARAQVDFRRDIQPVLESKCLSCHNPNNAKGDLSLAQRGQLIEKSLIEPGSATESELYLAVISDDDDERPYMPKKGDPLTDEETRLLKEWIDTGADWPEDVTLREASRADRSWWAYQPLTRPRHDSIDAYIRERLTDAGLEMNPPADRRVLIRRATYDLTGLLPTPAEVEAFLQDKAPDAFAKVVDRLLESPRYGEHWGRHWLDVVRFGESNGFERNVLINNLWPFRDYVIRSVNSDKPFDEFIREHIAGDVLQPDNPGSVVGSAFLVAGPYDDVGNQDAAAAAQIRANTLDEIINATSQAFLGMTVGCARCHDHKFDPIKQEDYYRLYATFSAVRHGSAPLATPQQVQSRAKQLGPLQGKKSDLEKQLRAIDERILARATAKIQDFQALWSRPRVDRTGTEERFDPVEARFVRFRCLAADNNPAARTFTLDEFEIWNTNAPARNVALAAAGAKASGAARRIEDFDGAYSADLAIDGETGARFISAADSLTIELAEATLINRVVFSSAKGEEIPQHGKFRFVADYIIEVSTDGEAWSEVASGRDRQPVSEQHKRHRLLVAETTAQDRKDRQQLRAQLAAVNAEIAKVPPLEQVWIGTRSAGDATGPFHVFVGGNPQKRGATITAGSLSTLAMVTPTFELAAGDPESVRRQRLAEWITHPDNPLTPRVLANRLWHYHFGTGIVDTPNDFGYMGGRPTHPELLDYLAGQLQDHGWKLKPLHRLMMLSDTYQQSSAYRQTAAAQDGGSRLLWRFPPRRLSAEEIRDTLLSVAGKLDTTMGGPGFRLYHFMQDNVCTYEPLDRHGPGTYRRAVYHQNARASVVDLMTEYDQPDCAFSAPRRAQTTTPLQALTMLNHTFTVDMAAALAERVGPGEPEEQSTKLFRLAYQRLPDAEERSRVAAAIRRTGLSSVCRAILNSSELIYVD